jgi:hypothetical protein
VLICGWDVGLSHRSRLARGWTIALAALAMGVTLLDARAIFAPPPLPGAAQPYESTITSGDLRASLEFLASDALAGRGVGHQGNETAVRYLASMLARFGVAPVLPGFLQAVPIVWPVLGRNNVLELRRTGIDRRKARWMVGEEFFPAAGSPPADVTAPMVFAGRGRVDPGRSIDDFAGLDVRGRIVVILERPREERDRGAAREPSLSPASWLAPDLETIDAKAREAARRGAVALVIVGRDRRLRGFDTTWPHDPSVRQRHYRLASDALPIPVARVAEGPGTVLLHLGRANAPVASIGALAERAGLRFLVDGELRLRVDIDSQPVTVHNVLGLVAGRDSGARHDLVVVGAHLDHDGIDASGTVYNGADDDGSGTVAVLEVAEALAEAARAGWAPRRSNMLALLKTEEKR